MQANLKQGLSFAKCYQMCCKAWEVCCFFPPNLPPVAPLHLIYPLPLLASPYECACFPLDLSFGAATKASNIVYTCAISLAVQQNTEIETELNIKCDMQAVTDKLVIAAKDFSNDK